jgi:glutathione reductase (NADPH)
MSQSMRQCDLFVIGGGSGGVRAARVAARHGARVMIAEEYRWGGTCVIRGCVPKKLFVYASRFRDEFEDAPGFGWSLTAPRFDWPTLVANKDAEIARLEGLYRSGLQKAGAEVLKGRAELLDANTVLVEPGARRIEARVILIAVGARPTLPQVPGIQHAITSNEAFQLERLPPSILIAGGGYIAVEFASIFHGLGVATTLVYRGPKILRGFDEALRDGLTAALRERGIAIDCHAEIAAIAKEGKHFRVTLKDGSVRTTGLVMFATGRAPNTRALGLERAGVALGAKGAILVDALSRSSVPSIYAVGDVTDRVNLTPVAIREGHAFADTVFGNTPTAVNHELVPTAVFATPEIGTVGLPEHAARIRYPRLDVYKAEFRPLKGTLSGRRERMLMKLLVDGASDRVVGCHVLGVDAAEIAQMAAIAMHMGARKADFDQTLALHPSAAEELVTMREKWSASAAVPPIERGGDAAS